jgi:hypothetical protein
MAHNWIMGGPALANLWMLGSGAGKGPPHPDVPTVPGDRDGNETDAIYFWESMVWVLIRTFLCLCIIPNT